VLRHVVLLKWTEGASAAQKQAVLDALAALPGQIPEVRSYVFGPDAGLSDGNHDLAIVADFDDAAAYQAYAKHPDHVAMITQHVRPILAARAAAQYEVR
jgi:hypothetical protein